MFGFKRKIKEPLETPTRGKRALRNPIDDACNMSKDDIRGVLLKWSKDGKNYEVEGVVEEPPKKYTLKDIKKDYIKEAKEFIKQSKEFINKYGGWEYIVEDLTVYKSFQICISNLDNKIKEMEKLYNENK